MKICSLSNLRHLTWYFFVACSLRPPLRSSGQNSWLQIQRSGFDFRGYLIFWVVGLERGPLSLVSTIEELLERKSSGSGLESQQYGRSDPSHWPRGTVYPKKLVLISPTSGRRSVGILRSRTRATEFVWYTVWRMSSINRFFFIVLRPIQVSVFCCLTTWHNSLQIRSMLEFMKGDLPWCLTRCVYPSVLTLSKPTHTEIRAYLYGINHWWEKPNILWER
jgi:hypothetical protein